MQRRFRGYVAGEPIEHYKKINYALEFVKKYVSTYGNININNECFFVRYGETPHKKNLDFKQWDEVSPGLYLIKSKI